MTGTRNVNHAGSFLALTAPVTLRPGARGLGSSLARCPKALPKPITRHRHAKTTTAVRESVIRAPSAAQPTHHGDGNAPDVEERRAGKSGLGRKDPCLSAEYPEVRRRSVEELPARQLRELNEVAAGVVQLRDRR